MGRTESGHRSLATACRRQQFLADLIRILSHTGQKGPAVERTLLELRAVGYDEAGPTRPATPWASSVMAGG